MCLKRFRDSQCAVLEPFRNLDSSRRIPSKDRSRRIYWNRQKASLWQEAMGTTRTGTHAHRNGGNYPGSPVGICLCLLFAIFPGYHFSWFLSCKECVAGVGSVAQRAPLSWGYNQLKLPETEAGWRSGEGRWERGVTGQKRNVCGKFAPQSLFSLSVQFSLCSRNAGKMDAPLRPAFFTCVERKSQYFVTAFWLHYHTDASKSKVVCGEDCE